MKPEDKRKDQLINELVQTHQKIAQLEKSETDLKKIEEALRESEEKYRTIFENVSDTIIYVNKYGTIIDASDNEKSFGRKPRDIIGKNFTKCGFFKAKDIPKMLKLFKDVISGQKSINKMELEVKHKNGHEIPIEVSTTLVKKNHKIDGFVCLARDITERKRTEEILREREKKYRSLTDQLPIGVYRTTKEGKIIYTNPALASILDYESTKDLSQISTVNVYADPKDREKQLEQWKSSKGIICSEIKLQTKKGREIWVRDTGHVILDKNGQIDYIDGAIEDITERKKMAEALHTEKAYLEHLFKSAKEAIVMADNEGRIIRINSEFTQLFGYSPEETVGQLVDDLVATQDLQKEATSITKRVAEGETVSFEAQRRHKDGTLIHVSALASPIIIKGEQVAVYAIYRDITKRKKADEKLNAIYEFSKKMSLDLNIDQVSESVSDFAQKILNFNNFVIFLNDEEKRELYVKSVRGYSGEIKKLRFPIDEGRGIIVHAANTGKTIYIPDVRKDSRYVEEVPEIRSELAAPMKVGKKIIGVLNIESEKLDGFSEDNKRLLETLASQTAIAIQNARLYEEIQQELTERKQAEEALQAEKAHFEHLFESAKEAIVMGDSNGRIIRTNSEFTRLFGYTSEEPVGELIDDLIAPKDYYDNAVLITKKVAKGERAAFEAIRQRKDGKQIHVSVLASPIIIDNKQVGVYGIYRDITERKQAEEALQTEKAYLEKLFESAQEAIVMSDINHRVMRVNSEFTRVFGYTSEEAVGQSIDDMVAPKDISKEAELYTKYLGEGKRIAFEGVRRRKDGILIHVSAIGSPIIIDDKNVGYYAIYRDITDRKQAEEALQIEKAHLEKLFESAQEAIVMADNSGQVLRVNSEFTRLFGYTPEEAAGQSIDDLVADKNLKEEAKGYTKNLAEGKRVSFEGVRMRKDGTTIYVSATGSPIIVGNEQVGHYAIYRDISEQKYAEKELQHTMDRLRKAMRGTIQAVALTVETRDPYTAGHQQRVSDLARAIANEMGLSKDQIDGIRMAGLIHDIGKVGVPAEILSKPGRLNEYEYDLIKTHPQIGYDILKKIEFPWPVAQIILQHHERLDGSGYPSGLGGKRIVTGARILGVADVVEAMASHRPYRPALGIDKALEEISKNKGILYYPEVVEACMKLFTKKGFKFRLGTATTSTSKQ